MQSKDICDYCKHDTNEDWIWCCLYCVSGNKEEIMAPNFEGVEAIPVEQVARWIMRFTGYAPCDYMYHDEMQEKWRKGECKNGCRIDMTDADVYECWLHAIKEGWLDEWD